MTGVAVAGVGVLTAWGDGVRALPGDARAAAGDRRILPMARSPRGEEHLRRAPRECALALDAVEAVLGACGRQAAEIRGPETALVYVTAAAYGASNVAFLQLTGRGGGLAFPYTAASAVPGEAAIAFGLSGPATVLVGGPTATLDGLWTAARLVARGACARALVLAVETFEACAGLWDRRRWLLDGPLVESAACALLVPGRGRLQLRDEGRRGAGGADAVRRRAGETLSCGPLIALALALDAGHDPVSIDACWRGREARLDWEGPGMPPGRWSGRGGSETTEEAWTRTR